MVVRLRNSSFPTAESRSWRLLGAESGVFLFKALVVAAAILTCAVGTKPALALRDTNGTPLPPHPVLAEFGLTCEQVPEHVYIVRTPLSILARDGLVVHAQREGCAVVSGPMEAIRELWAMRADVVPIDLGTYAPPAPARVWRRVTEADPVIQEAVDDVTWDRVLPKIQMLVDFGPRSRCAPAILTDAVPESLAVFFRGLGLDVVLQEYSLPFWTYCEEVPTGHNVIATQEGVDYPDSILVICAHYDSYQGTGADDNATGVAAVMTAAELLSRHRFAYTIQYVCFGHEEYCGCGSGDFVWRAYRDHVNLIGALNFDMIGYWREGAVFDLEVEANAPSAWLAEAYVNAAELYTDTPCDTHITNLGFSDNTQFWMRGYSALNNEEAWLGHEGDFNPHWHTRKDLIQYVHPGFMVANTRTAVAGLATLARLVPTIRAIVDISPKTLNPSSQGRWITGRIELPAEYDLAQVDMSSIRLNETVAAEARSSAVRDGGKGKNAELMVKFSRMEVVSVLGESDRVTLRISGRVGQERFEGCDTIRVVRSPAAWAVEGMDSDAANSLELLTNFPNPLNPTTTISFSLLQSAHVVLSIYGVDGTLVATLVDDILDEGLRRVSWDGRDFHGNPVGSGVYFCRLTADDKTLTKKMVLLK